MILLLRIHRRSPSRWVSSWLQVQLSWTYRPFLLICLAFILREILQKRILLCFYHFFLSWPSYLLFLRGDPYSIKWFSHCIQLVLYDTEIRNFPFSLHQLISMPHCIAQFCLWSQLLDFFYCLLLTIPFCIWNKH